jgi:hypothetical protein
MKCQDVAKVRREIRKKRELVGARATKDCGETMLPKQSIDSFPDSGHYSLLRTTEAFNAATAAPGHQGNLWC